MNAMKNLKLTYVAVLLIAACTSGLAQSRNFKFGVKAGANLSSLRGDAVYNSGDPSVRIGNADTRLTGFVGGAFVRLGGSLFVQPELLLSQKGGTYNVFRDGVSDDDNRVDVRFTNLDVPVLVGIRIGEVLRLNAGPIASLRMSENGGLRRALNEIGATSVEDNFKRATLGYQAGVGFDIGNLSLDLRYEGNLSNIVDVDRGNSDLNSAMRHKGNLWQATLGFAIF